ncbi:hypothetical protein KQI74_28145 [Paenibacillus barcinonensis]|uniref:hypothetical protein n=1 Tax=Paenibacillus barcinonensis TaxID=198119 RepID=UPI001C10CF9B|nr:hypothetical protein [Paenibacillus barcinonensis]MBU5356127.1 hypothetical protein [Paenibacillus barcinonensis]
MEQLITIEQLKELSPEQKECLRNWWYASNPGRLDLYVVLYKYDDGLKYEGPFMNTGERNFIEDFNTGEALPLMSIGQMMQLIADHATSTGAVWEIKHDWYKHIVTLRSVRSQDVILEASDTELHNALWVAVKQILQDK